MNMKALIVALSFLILLGAARADYQVKDANGTVITIKSFTCGSAQCPQTVLGGPTGVQAGTAASPLFLNPAPAVATVTTPTVTPGVFATVLASNPTRKGCTIWNNSETQGYCTWASSPAVGNSKTMLPGGEFSCSPSNSPPVSNAIACTCVSGTCTFVVTQQ